MLRAEAPSNHQPPIAGRYRIERSLGEGGMGAVYAVLDETTGRRVALKRLSDGLGDVALKLFEDEYRTLASLRHPGIVEAYEFGTVGDGAFYTMEILEGGDLSQSAPVPWREACSYLRDAASILGVLHARRLVHRDVSPRNLWRTLDGRIKLLDFGSLASFGEARDVVGTPAFMPPEALQAYHVDQRTDLYALGALGYWLMTSAHAYRARRLAELPELWERQPLPPSELVKLLGAESSVVPPELDQLILSLLSLDPRERPVSTVDVIDRLNDIAGLEPEARDAVVQGYLESKAFVGRLEERRALEVCLLAADGGSPSSLVFEGPEGSGRSRLLQELTLTARIAGATVARAGREASGEPYGASIALGLGLLEALPEAARSAALPHAAVLAELSPDLQRALGSTSYEPGPLLGSTARARKQTALASWILTLSRTHTLALIVDDLDELDEESQAVLLTLLRSGLEQRLCVVSAIRSGHGAEPSHALQALRASSKLVQLAPLSEHETLELLRSLFGEVPYLTRLNGRLHKLSDGNPEHCLLMARQLVAAGLIRYADGTWALPQELPDAQLPTSLRTGLLASLERLGADERALARALSVPDHGVLTLSLVMAASKLSRSEATARLAALSKHGVVQLASGGYRLTHEVQRQALYAELSAAERADVHRVLAQQLQIAAGSDSLTKLRAALHWLRADEPQRAEPLLFEAGQANMQSTVTETLRQAAPMFADVVAVLDASGRDDHVLWLPLSVLAYAGYFIDRRYAQQYGARAVAVLSEAMHMALARRLSPWLGARISMVAAVVTAGIQLRRKSHAPRLQQLIYCLVSASTTTAGSAGITLDAKAVRRFAHALQPLSVLRSAGVVRCVVHFNLAIATVVEGKTSEGQAMFREVIALLESKDGVAGMPAETRDHYLATSLSLHGLYDAWACKPESLEYASKAESFGPFHAIWANQVRALYWTLQGQQARAAHYEAQLELQAIQLASTWQVETWKPSTRLLSLAHDAVATKRAADELDRFGEYMPSYAIYARWVRAQYWVLRGNYAAALELYRGDDVEPTDLAGWSVGRGWYAAAYNGLRQHERARRLCQHTLERLSESNRKVVYISVLVEVELALADAGLGALDAARSRLQKLMLQHCPGTGPMVNGFLHCAQARVAVVANDPATARQQLELAAAEYAPLEIASLNEHVAALRHACRSKDTLESSVLDGGQPVLRTDGHFLTRMEVVLQSVGHATHGERASKALRLALELAACDRGFVVDEHGALVASYGAIPEHVTTWARDALAARRKDEDEDEATVFATSSDETTTTTANHRLSWEDVHYRSELLWRQGRNETLPSAVLVMGALGKEPRALPSDVLRTIASGLTQKSLSAANDV